MGLSDCLTEVQQIGTDEDIVECPEADTVETPSATKDILIPPQEKSKITLDPNSWKYLTAGVASAPLAFFLGVAVHEGSHCIAANLVESTYCMDVRLIPYTDEETGYFYFGSMRYGFHDENTPPTPNENALITAAPMLVNMSFISAYSTLAFTNKLPKNKWAKTGMLVLAASQVVDLGNHIGNKHPFSDSGKLINFFEHDCGLDHDHAVHAVKGPQIGFVALGASAIALEGFRIFTVREDSHKDSRIKVTPSLTQGGFHLGLSGTF